MKALIAIVATLFALNSFAADAPKAEVKKDEKKAEVNCVTKDKKGNCPPAPKSEKPTPKKVEAKKDEAKK